MFAQSQPKPDMIDLISRLKLRHGLRVATVSNEGRELAIYRIRKFNLHAFVDFFISSCFVHFRKPDVDIYRVALDCAQVPAEEVVYIDDRAMFVEVAKGLGIHGIWHTSYASTRAALEALGLVDEV
jgi:putative hydrolase of the HAD superfamily